MAVVREITSRYTGSEQFTFTFLRMRNALFFETFYCMHSAIIFFF
jgi:hypothetical protein